MTSSTQELSLSEIVDLIQRSQQDLEKVGSELAPVRQALEVDGTCDVCTTSWDRAFFQLMMKRFDVLEAFVKQNQLLLLQLARQSQPQ